MEIEERFKQFEDDFLEFDKIVNRRNDRPDLHAWLLLDELFPKPGFDMICAASHDEIWLDVDDSDVKKLTDKQILELIRCGVRCDEHGLAMYV